MRLKWEKAGILHFITPSPLQSWALRLASHFSINQSTKTPTSHPYSGFGEQLSAKISTPPGHLLTACPWASHWTSQNLHFLIWWMEVTVTCSPTSQHGCKGDQKLPHLEWIKSWKCHIWEVIWGLLPWWGFMPSYPPSITCSQKRNRKYHLLTREVIPARGSLIFNWHQSLKVEEVMWHFRCCGGSRRRV